MVLVLRDAKQIPKPKESIPVKKSNIYGKDVHLYHVQHNPNQLQMPTNPTEV
jgi:hypothetical protein